MSDSVFTSIAKRVRKRSTPKGCEGRPELNGEKAPTYVVSQEGELKRVDRQTGEKLPDGTKILRFSGDTADPVALTLRQRLGLEDLPVGWTLETVRAEFNGMSPAQINNAIGLGDLTAGLSYVPVQVKALSPQGLREALSRAEELAANQRAHGAPVISLEGAIRQRRWLLARLEWSEAALDDPTMRDRLLMDSAIACSQATGKNLFDCIDEARQLVTAARAVWGERASDYSSLARFIYKSKDPLFPSEVAAELQKLSEQLNTMMGLAPESPVRAAIGRGMDTQRALNCSALITALAERSSAAAGNVLAALEKSSGPDMQVDVSPRMAKWCAANGYASIVKEIDSRTVLDLNSDDVDTVMALVDADALTRFGRALEAGDPLAMALQAAGGASHDDAVWAYFAPDSVVAPNTMELLTGVARFGNSAAERRNLMELLPQVPMDAATAQHMLDSGNQRNAVDRAKAKAANHQRWALGALAGFNTTGLTKGETQTLLSALERGLLPVRQDQDVASYVGSVHRHIALIGSNLALDLVPGELRESGEHGVSVSAATSVLAAATQFAGASELRVSAPGGALSAVNAAAAAVRNAPDGMKEEVAFAAAAVLRNPTSLLPPVALARDGLTTEPMKQEFINKVLEAANDVRSGKRSIADLSLINDTNPYRFAVSQSVPQGPTFGVEWTKPEELGRPLVGNLDPQHDGTASEIAAIEAALQAPLPPRGVTLATVRPDMDAFGAMAVLSLRASGALDGLNAGQLATFNERVATVATADRRGDLPKTWAPAPAPYDPEYIENKDIVRLSQAVRSMTAQEAVDQMQGWLSGKAITAGEDAIQSRLESQRRMHAAFQQQVTSGELQIHDGPVRWAAARDVAPDLIYHQTAPVAVLSRAFEKGSEGARTYKHTIAVHPGYDWRIPQDLINELNRREVQSGGVAQWGGPNNGKLLGSPQGVNSRLNQDEFRAICASFMS